MDFKRRLGLLLAGTVLGTSILISAPAFADDAQLQQQINAMQRQLQAMQDQLAETKKQAKAAAQQAQQTQQAQPRSNRGRTATTAQNLPANIPPNLYAADVPIPTKGRTLVVRQHPRLDGRLVHRDGRCVPRSAMKTPSGASDPLLRHNAAAELAALSRERVARSVPNRAASR